MSLFERDEREKKTERYQSYAAECLRVISENTAKMVGGAYMPCKLDELAHYKPKPQLKPGEAFARIKKKLGG